MLPSRIMQAENHAGRGDRRDRDIVEGLAVSSRNKIQLAGLRLEVSPIKNRSQIVRHIAGTLAISGQPFRSRILIDDAAVRFANDNDVFNAGEDGIVEGKKSHQLVVEK